MGEIARVGEIVSAAVVGHVPTVMLEPGVRRRLGGTGEDTTLVEGFRRLRAHFEAKAVDTWVVFDTHWFTTTEHVIAGAAHHRGLYTSEELPRVIHELPFDYAGAPELAEAIRTAARERGIRVTNATTPTLPRHYPTINLVHHLYRGEKVLSVGVCQTAEMDDYLAFGEAIGAGVARTGAREAIGAGAARTGAREAIGTGAVRTGAREAIGTGAARTGAREAIGTGAARTGAREAIGTGAARTGARVALLGSGGLSHRFWPLRELFHHQGYDPRHVITPQARAADRHVLDCWERGDHAAVCDFYPEYRTHAPEGRFAHYLMLLGAIGGRACKARGERYSAYESSIGTGQVHVVFDLDPKPP